MVFLPKIAQKHKHNSYNKKGKYAATKKWVLLGLILLVIPCTCSCNKSEVENSREKTKIIKDAKSAKTQYDDKTGKQLSAPPTEIKDNTYSNGASQGQGEDFSDESSKNNTGNASGQSNLKAQTNASSKNIDIDLTKANSNIIYSQIAQMLATPNDYLGKRIKLSGSFIAYDPAPDSNANVDKYFAIFISDATACCQQGMEFIWPGHSYPAEFPEQYGQLTITGKFTTYNENGKTYCQIVADNVEF